MILSRWLQNKTNLNLISQRYTLQIQVEDKKLNINMKKTDIVRVISDKVDFKAEKL